MSADHNHINYSAADIEKYHRGELSAATMHAMEKAALDDPFLADAMEGYGTAVENNSEQNIQTGINELRQRVATRIKEEDTKPVIGIAWWKVAAVVAVILGAAWLYTAINSKTKEQDLATNNKKATERPAVSVGAPKTDSYSRKGNDTVAQSADIAINERKLPVTANDEVKASAKPATRISSPSAGQSKNSTANTERLETKLPGKPRSVDITNGDSSLTAALVTDPEKNNGLRRDHAGKKEKLQEMESAPAASLAISGNLFKGTVVDQSNKPVVNALIQVPKLNKAYTTDNNGHFSFNAPDTAVNVSIASVGFAQQNTRLSNSIVPNNQIVLQPDTRRLDEVVVVGYGSKRKQDLRSQTKDFSINVLDAEPSVNWNEYTAYLEKNKRITEHTTDLHGDVVVSFVINKKNELTNFKIEKSLQSDLDAEAIRLIKEGPSWKLLKGKKAKASVIVKF